MEAAKATHEIAASQTSWYARRARSIREEFGPVNSGFPMRQTGCDRRRMEARGSCTAMRVEAGQFEQFGWIWALRDGVGVLREVHLAESALSVPVGAEGLGEELRVALEEYVMGEDAGLRRLVLAPSSSTFAQGVREALWSIPRGEVRTYGQLARAMGKPKAARAVGRACATNPLPLVVPCHRVVAALGLGGFGPGLAIKRALLSYEGIDVAMCPCFR